MNGEYEYQFIGRDEAIHAFHSLRSLREQKNALYLEALGGLGKTRLLHEYIHQCNLQRRPWHVSPPNSTVDPVIDFFDFENRSVAGLRRSIVSRLGSQYFATFLEKENAALSLEAQIHQGHGTLQSRALVLQLEAEQAFFNDFKRALRVIKNYTVLLLDTFELVANQRVGRWFLEEFLPNPATTGCLIVFAGRPTSKAQELRTAETTSSINLPLNVQFFELKPFGEREMKEYFARKYNTPFETPEQTILLKSEGNPLIVDLLVHYLTRLAGKVEDLQSRTETEIKEMVVKRFLTPLDSTHEVIHDMAYLKRRYNRSLFDILKAGYGGEQDFLAVSKTLEGLPFVKVRHDNHGDPILTLHDVFQEMLEAIGGGDWRSVSDELYAEVVTNWYPNSAIPAAATNSERNVLRAEHLGYVLARDAYGEGLRTYQQYFKLAQSSSDYELGEVVWGEMQGHVTKLTDGYLLCREHATWLSKTGQYGAAAVAFQFILDHYTDPPESLLFAQMHLGYALHELGRDNEYDLVPVSTERSLAGSAARLLTARTAFVTGLGEAERVGNAAYKVAFSHQLGRIEQAAGHWEEAREQYEKAIAIKPNSVSGDADALPENEALVAWAQASLSLALLEARMGIYAQAEDRSRTSLEALRLSSMARELDLGNAYYTLAQIERYSNHPETAIAHYDRAVKLAQENTAFLAAFRQARGANHHELGLRHRQEHDDITSAIDAQKNAYDDVFQSIDSCRSAAIKSRIPDGLRRMGNIFREVHELERYVLDNGQSPEVLAQLDGLRQAMGEFQLTEESHWLNLHRLSADPAFVYLADYLAKAQRLFEVSYLEADDVGLYHECLDGLAEAQRAAIARGRDEEARKYIRFTETLRAYDYQAPLYEAHVGLAYDHLHWDRGDFIDAVDGYSRHFVAFAESGGYARTRLDTEFEEMERRFLHTSTVPRARKIEFCELIEKAWTDQGLTSVYPKLLLKIRALRTKLLAK